MIALDQSQRVIAARSKSFALASKLLPRRPREDATVLYAWCRRADDSVDEAPPAEAAVRLGALRAELDLAYQTSSDFDSQRSGDELTMGLREVVRRCGIPRAYPGELLEGMQMDLDGASYETLDDLLVYCHRAAGTVGLMMAHVLGVERADALPHAAHLGMAMQLTNICRDVAEDLGRGRVYLPAQWLRREGAAADWAARAASGDIDDTSRRAVARVVTRCLDEADRFYASGERGVSTLPWRAAIAVRAAHWMYAAIGSRLRVRRGDSLSGRVFVSGPRKVAVIAAAVGSALLTAGWLRLRRRRLDHLELRAHSADATAPLSYPDDLSLV